MVAAWMETTAGCYYSCCDCETYVVCDLFFFFGFFFLKLDLTKERHVEFSLFDERDLISLALWAVRENFIMW